jgi:hypothetical protein
MKRYYLVFTSTLAICVTLCGTVQGEPVYSQVFPQDPLGALGSQEFPNAPKVADSFLIEGTDPIRIRSVRFIGGYGLRNPPPITPPLDALPEDNFRILFLADAAGSPGLPISGGDFSSAAQLRAPTGRQLLQGVYSPIEYVVNLGEGIELSAETVYWLAVINDAGPEHGWLWAEAKGVFDQKLATTFENAIAGPWNIYDGGMYFELDDQSIPEPTSIVVAFMALWPALFNRRRRSISGSQIFVCKECVYISDVNGGHYVSQTKS